MNILIITFRVVLSFVMVWCGAVREVLSWKWQMRSMAVRCLGKPLSLAVVHSAIPTVHAGHVASFSSRTRPKQIMTSAVFHPSSERPAAPGSLYFPEGNQSNMILPLAWDCSPNVRKYWTTHESQRKYWKLEESQGKSSVLKKISGDK